MKDIVAKCQIVGRGISSALRWMEEFASEEKQRASLAKLKKLNREIKKLERATHLKPAVALFGPSQAGKSFMVGLLAKSSSDEVMYVADDATGKMYDFTDQINPPGGKESTGLVTRFTVERHVGQPADKPIMVKLFSQVDLVKIIAVGFHKNIIEPATCPREQLLGEVEKVLADLRGEMRETPYPEIDEDQIMGIKEYLSMKLGDKYIIRTLDEMSFWERAAEILPYVSWDKRYELLQFIWGKHDFFNDLFILLSRGLSTLNFANMAYVGFDALVPREVSIIDVSRYSEIKESEEEWCRKNARTGVRTKSLEVSAGGKLANIDRTILSALISELVLTLPTNVLEDHSRDFLKNADILDFPGERSADMFKERDFVVKGFEDQLKVFLRGRVSYLFDYYSLNFGISSLCLVLGDGNHEVAQLPHLILEWIHGIHGESPEARARKESDTKMLTGQDYANPLFVILSKFNTAFDKGNAMKKEGYYSIWNGRFDDNFSQAYTKQMTDVWTKKWTDKDSFKNVFILRNPMFSKAYFKNRGGETHVWEEGLKDEFEVMMSYMRESFVTNENVRSLVDKPEACWDDMIQPNHSGIDYMMPYLTPVTDPRIKKKQIEDAVEQVRKIVLNELEQYYVGGNIEVELSKAKKNALQTNLLIGKMISEQRTGKFITALSCPDYVARRVYQEFVNGQFAVQKEVSQVNVSDNQVLVDLLDSYGIQVVPGKTRYEEIISQLKTVTDIDDEKMLLEVIGEAGIDEADLHALAFYDRTKENDPVYQFVNRLVGEWLRHIDSMDSSRLKEEFCIVNPVAFVQVVGVLKDNYERVGLKERLVDALRSQVESYDVSRNQNFELVTRIASSVINQFVFSLGWIWVPVSERPVQKSSGTPIFTPGEEGMDIAQSWRTGLVESFVANVYFKSKVDNKSKLKSMSKLGEIIHSIQED